MGVVLLVLARVAPEESARLELPVRVEVPVALGVRHLRDVDLDEVFVALFFLDLVPLNDVVEAVGVEARVRASAPAPDGVLGPDVLLALAPSEHELGAFVTVSVFVVGEVFNIVVEDADHVDGVPAVGDHQDCQGLVSETNEAELLRLGIVNGRLEDFLDRFLGQSVRALRFVVLPLVVLGHPAEHVEDAGVVLEVVLVDGRTVILREGVVEPLVGLLNARLAADLEELDEEVGDVLVGEELLGRDHVVLVDGFPLQIIYFAELVGVLSQRKNIFLFCDLVNNKILLTASTHYSERTFFTCAFAIGRNVLIVIPFASLDRSPVLILRRVRAEKLGLGL